MRPSEGVRAERAGAGAVLLLACCLWGMHEVGLCGLGLCASSACARHPLHPPASHTQPHPLATCSVWVYFALQRLAIGLMSLAYLVVQAPHMFALLRSRHAWLFLVLSLSELSAVVLFLVGGRWQLSAPRPLGPLFWSVEGCLVHS